MGRSVLSFSEVNNSMVSQVGGKNASLGEMIGALSPEGINIPDGFATTAEAFIQFLEFNGIREQLHLLLSFCDVNDLISLSEASEKAKQLVLNSRLPSIVSDEIQQHVQSLLSKYGESMLFVVRSSATAEDLPTASFAGQHDSFLNVGAKEIEEHVIKCFASLYNARAIKYRSVNGFDHDKVFLSVGVQKQVRSDDSSSGVCFSIDPESGFKDIVYVSGCWGLGENIVQGTVNPDEFHLFKPALKSGKKAIVHRRLGSKSTFLVNDPAAAGGIKKDTPIEMRNQFVLTDEEIHLLGRWCVLIEEHYGMPMDIEWAKDGLDKQLYIVQARPETVHSQADLRHLKNYVLKEKGEVLVKGNSVGNGITSGRARIILSPEDAAHLQEGEILVTANTNPDWDPIMKKAAAIVTDKGGRTSHAAIVARELGALAIVGCEDATSRIKNGDLITVSCVQGKPGAVYSGSLKWEELTIDLNEIQLPEKTRAMLILGDPEGAYKYSFYPNHGVGLMRLEFIISNAVQVHPMAIVKYDELADEEKVKVDSVTKGYTDKRKFFIERLAESVGTIAAAFYPKDVIVRMSDFKSNEYANLIGGSGFEPKEENPMLGFRGASRYYHERYKEGFKLECAAMKMVREEMGLDNVKLMIPFCRTVEEGKKVLAVMEEEGLKRGVNGLEVYVMAELPSNVILAKEFAQVFDGFSIGSNDLTQLTLGLDRDSEIICDLFDENNEAVKTMIRMVIRAAKASGTKIGLCGQAPSDFPEFASFLVEEGINSISFNPDALIKGIGNMVSAEEKNK